MPRISALFVDFDNVYLSLQQSSSAGAKVFAENPMQWLRWFETGGHDSASDDPDARRILMRRTYLNPDRFGQFRKYFTYSGFHTIDCPSLTGQGKNSADIYMVLDILDALRHETHFDEFLILSADADFTPVLLRLREHDREATVMSTVVTSGALRRAATNTFDLEEFLQDALMISDSWPQEPQRARSTAPVTEQQVLDFIAHRVSVAEEPIKGSSLGSQILQRFGDSPKTSKWFGKGSLLRMIAESARSEIGVDANDQGGLVMDLRRQAPNKSADTSAALGEALQDLPDGLREVAERLGSVNWPRWTPAQYALFIELAAEHVLSGVTESSQLGGRLRDGLNLAVEQGRLSPKEMVNRKGVNFLLTGITHQGARFGDNCTTSREIADYLYLAMCKLYESRLGTPSDQDMAHMRALVPRPAETPAQPVEA